MDYRIIPISKLLGLTVNEAYTYLCLLAKTDFVTYISHVSLQTLCELTGIKKTETISGHIDTLIDKGLVLRKYRYRREGTNTYELYKPEKDFVRVNLQLLRTDIPVKLKGFLILLKCLCLNNTNYTGYCKSEISKLLNISRPTIDSYLKECIALRLVKEEKTGFTITNSEIFIIDPVRGSGEFHDVFFVPVRNYLIDKGIIPPHYDEKIFRRFTSCYSSPDYIIAALDKRKIPKGTNCSWQYLAKVLNVSIEIHPIKRNSYGVDFRL
ncbi:putative transcriptional regulator [Parabacteroides sp. PF5-5]|uniref:hypothetical protein n=1 Tax=unclassified Parabacteroides TaxID=2649774 RepID=UPI00247717D2|nr:MULTISPECIES: hypothetical protein [unclassified Parabacteroides]MDH6304284.1 putative transcriptional regulator [Parabacteroides sp. PH5-39]MDH6315001.1 putative transcriptional regulator [Parabacteroides sp. PF5-13]MDH6318661.1 putative transcriptional regulator [Parabacteroides sp. PH5-13]MDH6322391.1 putative transcriptional regulator [Parabacteroides sp. PH5-8]MDH6326474.1 putative transcriptional regulator [Parabacteroides sp. PH5-41]